MTIARWKNVTAAAALGVTVALGACAEGDPAPVEVEGVIAGLEITNARLVLPPVAGNPAAVYFDATYNGPNGISITGAAVEGAASATVHAMMEYDFEMTMAEAGPVAIRNGETLTFAPGELHVMAFELAEGVDADGTVEVTLETMGGDKHKFSAEVRAAGEER
ncbi:MAG: copper chaperone PCu(A)C [Pseudomonadota bacterium]